MAGVLFPFLVHSDIVVRPGRVFAFDAACVAAGLSVAALSVGIAYLTLYRANRTLATVAQRDPLTGLYHHGQLMSHLESMVARTSFAGPGLSLIIADIDHFKNINDVHGHLVGDDVLVRIACMLQATANPAGQVFRMGGEEFAIVLPDVAKHRAGQLAENVRVTVERFEDDTIPPVTISLGIAHYPEDAQSLTELIKHADDAMYLAKRRGRNRVQFWSELS